MSQSQVPVFRPVPVTRPSRVWFAVLSAVVVVTVIGLLVSLLRTPTIRYEVDSRTLTITSVLGSEHQRKTIDLARIAEAKPEWLQRRRAALRDREARLLRGLLRLPAGRRGLAGHRLLGAGRGADVERGGDAGGGNPGRPGRLLEGVAGRPAVGVRGPRQAGRGVVGQPVRRDRRGRARARGARGRPLRRSGAPALHRPRRRSRGRDAAAAAGGAARRREGARAPAAGRPPAGRASAAGLPRRLVGARQHGHLGVRVGGRRGRA